MLTTLKQEMKAKNKTPFPKKVVQLKYIDRNSIEVIAENITDKMIIKLKKNFC